MGGLRVAGHRRRSRLVSGAEPGPKIVEGPCRAETFPIAVEDACVVIDVG